MKTQYAKLVKTFKVETHDGYSFNVQSVDAPRTCSAVRDALAAADKKVKIKPPSADSFLVESKDAVSEKDATLTPAEASAVYTAHCEEVGVTI